MFVNTILQKTNEVKMNYSKGRKIYIAISAILVIAVAIIIFYLSHQTSTESSNTSDSLIGLIFTLIGQTFSTEFIRSLAHFCEFAGFGFLMINLLFSLKDKLKPFLSVLFSFGYAVTDEIHQIFIPGRAFQLIDLTIDLGGIVLGVVVFCLLIFIKYKVQKYKV
jgi:VanZ family protein